MGDIADSIIDQMFDPWCEEEMEDYYSYTALVQCKYCKQRGFHWMNIGTEEQPIWRLHTPTGKLHKCKAYRETEGGGTTKYGIKTVS